MASNRLEYLLDINNFKIGQQITSLQTIAGMEKHSKQDMTRNRNAVLRLKAKLEAEKIELAKEYLEVLNKDQRASLGAKDPSKPMGHPVNHTET